MLFWLSQTWLVAFRIQKWVLSSCTLMPDSKQTKLGGSNQEVSPSADKSTRVILLSRCEWKGVCLYNYFPMVWIFLRSFDLICYTRWVLNDNHENYLRISVSCTYRLLFWFLHVNEMTILPKAYKLDTFESQSPLKRYSVFTVAVFSIWNSLRVLQKVRIKIVVHANHLYLFFSLAYTLLFCGKIKSCCDHCFPQQIRPQKLCSIIYITTLSWWENWFQYFKMNKFPVQLNQTYKLINQTMSSRL